MGSEDLPVRITGSERGLGHKLEIGDRDLSNSVTRAELVIDPNSGTVLRLHMAGVHVLGAGTRARVIVDDETAEALKVIGWTPPEGAPA